jgi:TPR repeat protein
VEWFRKAAEQGMASAQLNIGNMYNNGEGVPQSYSKAVRWYRKAAEQGAAKAQFNLGNMYDTGEGVSRNPVMAYVVNNLAAAQGHESARNNRDIIANDLSREQIAEGQRMASEWRVGAPLPYLKDFNTWP